MAGALLASGQQGGTVFCSAATWWVFVARQGDSLVFCPVVPVTPNRHRADVPLPWAEALHAGCPEGYVVRCRPVLRASLHGLVRKGQFGTVLTHRIYAALAAELRQRQQEEEALLLAPSHAFFRHPAYPASAPNPASGAQAARRASTQPPGKFSGPLQGPSCSGAFRVTAFHRHSHTSEPRSPTALHFF